MSMETIRTAFGILTIATLSASLGGCAEVAGDSTNADAPEPAEESVAEASQAVIDGWTGWISEETSPGVCDQNSVVTAVRFQGSYSDDIKLRCTPSVGRRANTYWTKWISEESPNNSIMCPNNAWVVGLECKGSYCDQVRVQCAYYSDIRSNFCTWTPWASEEEGYATIAAGKAVRGVACDHDYCDNMRFCVSEGWFGIAL